ncbi:IS5 family transposase [uncultured Ruegeria sp.]|uniref:IS5 family transposase n=1 Tax=uncultured Ruegeria sp. TaxID=259304 RepID=UPI002638F022|nr:IS5 family transposase [uncultured Ruegeria sp.]
MPYKFNDARRDKFDKAQYSVTNWSEYNESLRQRGDVTIWVSDDVAQNWSSPRRKTRGGQPRYSDLAIEICLTLRVVFRLALRQTQGFMRSIAKLMGMEFLVPDFSTLSRRGKALKLVQNRRAASRPTTLIVDSTGLKVHGGNDWHEEKHGTKKARKTWRKLHIGLDPETGDIVASKLTTEHVGDETALPHLLSDMDEDVGRFLADGAYDGQGVTDCLIEKFGHEVEIIIPPPKNAVRCKNAQRNHHIDVIAQIGRMSWQTKTGYNERSRVEAQIGRWKQAIGDRLQAHDFDNQIVEAKIASKALNRMTGLGRAVYERVV